MPGSLKVTSVQVLLYYPNLVGYARIGFIIASFYYASKDEWKLSMIFYALAFMGDVADGFVARAFNQCKS